MSNHYIRKNSSSFYVRKSNNNYYVSDNSPSDITTGLILDVDAGNISSYPGSGTTWYDLASPSNNLTLGRSDMYASDYGGGSMFVQGYYADISDYNDYSSYLDYLNFGTDAFSIQLWTMITNTTDPQYQDILNIGTYADGILIRYINTVYVGTDSLYIAGAYYDWNSPTNMVQDSWTHMTLVKSGTNVKFYINSVEIINENTAPSIVSPSAGILIGRPAHTPYGEAYTGYLSTLKIYRGYALTASDISQNFNATKSRYGL